MKKIALITNHSLSTSIGSASYYRFIVEKVNYKIEWYIVGRFRSVPEWMKLPSKPNIYNYVGGYRKVNKLIKKALPLKIYYFFLKVLMESIAKDIIKSLREKNIDFVIIHAVEHLIILAFFLQKSMNIKVHLNIQDEFEATLSKEEFKHLKYFYKYLLNNSYSIDVVSDEMKRYLIQKYNLQRQIFVHFAVYIPEIRFQLPKAEKNKKLVFIGNFKSESNFMIVLKFIKYLREMLKEDIKLNIYGTKNKWYFENQEFIVYMGELNHEKLIIELAQYMVGLSIMSFHLKDKLLIQTSLPSKTFSYIIANLPIINIAPDDAAINRYIEERGLGININTSNSLEVAKISSKILINNNLLSTIKNNQKEFYSSILENRITFPLIQYFQNIIT